MQKSRLRSTTSLVVSFGLIASPIAAQQTADTPEDLSLCVGLVAEQAIEEAVHEGVDGTDVDVEPDVSFPCLDASGAVITDQATLDAAVAAQIDEVMAEDVAPEEAVVEEAPATAEEEATAEAETEAAADDAASEEAPVAEVEEVAPADDVAAEESEVAEEPAATEEPAVTVDSDTATETAETEEPVVTEQTADVAVEETASAEDTALPEGDPEVEAVAEGLPEGGDDDVVDAEGLPEGDDAAEVAEELPTIIEDEEAPTAAAAAAAAAAEADPDATPEGEIAVEEVTEDDVRASDEDFTTSATGDAAAATTETAEAREDDDDGLSNFERALLLGLGAAVVGSVLNNGDEVVSNSGDRVVVERDGELFVLKDDDVLLRQPGSQIQTQSFDDGSTITTVTRASGDRIVTIRAADGRVLRRSRVLEDGTEVVLFDDTETAEPVDLVALPEADDVTAPEVQASQADVDILRSALMAEQNARIDRTFSLRQVRQIREVRELAPQVELDTVTFASGSAAIEPSQAEELTDLGLTIASIIEEDPGQVFLIEGHTDAVGDAGYNLALSDRRAETVALALTEYFGVPPENLITQGYGESVLKVATLEAERANRRAAVRNITELLR